MSKTWPTEKEFEALSVEVMRSFAPRIRQCRKCGHPVADGWICRYCGADEVTKNDEYRPRKK